MGCQIVVEPVREGVTKGLQPGRGLRIGRLGLIQGHVEAGTHITVERVLPLEFGQPADGPHIVAFNTGKIVLRLRVQHAKHRVGIRGGVNMGNTEIITNDFYPLRPGLQTFKFRR